MTGYFTVPRGVMDDPRLGPPEPFTRRQAWIWMLEQAAWKPVQVYVEGAVVALERGQLSHSTRFLADAWGWDRSRVRRLLAHVSRMNMARVETDPGQTVITICNYKEISGRDRNIDPLPTQDRPSTDPKKKQGNTETDSNADALRAPHAKPPPVDDLFTPRSDETPREVLWSEGLSLASKITGRQGQAARRFVGKLLALTKTEDHAGVVGILRDAMARMPLMDAEATLVARATALGGGRSASQVRSDRLDGYYADPPGQKPSFDIEITDFQEISA